MREAWIADFTTTLTQETKGAYVNVLMAEGAERVRGAHPGATWDRLRGSRRNTIQQICSG